MEFNPLHVALLLLVAALVAMITSRLKLPYSVGLVLAGFCLGASPLASDFSLTRELIFNILLPPLIFEAAFAIHWKELKTNLPVILVLATLGVILSTGVTALGMNVLAGWEWSAALLFGILISATDPVSVIATFKEAGVKGRLRLLVEAESLFNDGTAAVGFSLALALAMGQAIQPMDMVLGLFYTIFGGVAIGGAVAWGLLFLAGKTDDHLVEITFTTVAAYSSFLLAEHFHCSGVLGTLTTGIVLGNYGSLGSWTDRGREAVEAFWEYIAFVANAMVFLLIGIREVHQQFENVLYASGIAILLVTLGRALAIYPCCLLFTKSSLRVSANHQHILFWGGLRGALALALVLGLPESIPHREEITTVSFMVVTFSIFAQGLTITPLLKRLGELKSDEANDSRELSTNTP